MTRISCRYESYSSKAFNVMVDGKWHSTHYILATAIKEALKIKEKNPKVSVLVIKNMGFVECYSK